MKKVVVLEENELDDLIKNANIAKAILNDVLNRMDRNMQDENMGINSSNVADFYARLQSAKIAIDNVNDVFY